MTKLKNIVLSEAKLEDKITSRAKLTFGALIDVILDSTSKKIDEKNMSEFAKTLDITKSALERYVEAAKSNGFLNDDGTVVSKYATEKSGKIKNNGKISQALDSRMKKFRAPKVSSNNVFEQQVLKMLTLMLSQSKVAGVKKSFMLTGDPGVGKTSFIRSFSKLLGIPLIPIEAPHITEEHIINIPFMIITGNKVKKDNAVITTAGTHTLEDDADSFDIVQSESNLVTKLKMMKNYKLKGEQYKASIASDKNLWPLYRNYYRSHIEPIRDSFNAILFLDEYYRNDNMKIRNILRNILNGRIGNDKIPKGTFIVYASNIDDEGVEDIPMNNDFVEMEFKAPDKDSWFKWFMNTYIDNPDKKAFPGVDIKPEVFNNFYDGLTKEDLAFDDKNVEVRTSPRRWEQILLFINSALPVANLKEAKTLMSNLKVNFSNYIEDEQSSLYNKVEKIVVKIIKETSGIDFDGQPLADTEWKDTLQQQLEVKIKLDGDPSAKKDVRQYVPVVSGAPGIGKTAHMREVANNLDLHLIEIDTSTLLREDATGIPKAKQATDEDGNLLYDKDGNPVMTTEFSKPTLLDLIEKKMQEEIDEENAIIPEGERKKGQGKYKFLLLFDELTRADVQVFNTIRKLLLEKSFNENYDLPAEIMVVGALNPVDLGAEELTKHVRDVLDIIPARSSWAKTEKYLLSAERPAGLKEALGFDLNSATVGAIKIVLQQYQAQSGDLDHFGREIVKDERMFNLVDDGNIIYISPREITDTVSLANEYIVNRLTKAGIAGVIGGKVEEEEQEYASFDDLMKAMEEEENDSELQNNVKLEKGIFDLSARYSDEEYDMFIKAMIVEFRNAWAETLKWICTKAEIDATNVLSVTTSFISANDRIYDQFDAIKTMTVEDVKSIGEIFNAYYDDPDELYDSSHFDNYLSANFASPQKFTQEVTEFVADKISEIDSTANGTTSYEGPNGPVEVTSAEKQKLDLYFNYLKYVRVILKVLTKKSQYAGKVKEAERTGQYLGNLKISLETIGRNFMIKEDLAKFFSGEETKYLKGLKEGSKIAADIRDILEDFGIKVKRV